MPKKIATADTRSSAAASAGGQVLPDEELVEIVTNLVELPLPTVGRFEDEFRRRDTAVVVHTRERRGEAAFEKGLFVGRYSLDGQPVNRVAPPSSSSIFREAIPFQVLKFAESPNAPITHRTLLNMQKITY